MVCCNYTYIALYIHACLEKLTILHSRHIIILYIIQLIILYNVVYVMHALCEMRV